MKHLKITAAIVLPLGLAILIALCLKPDPLAPRFVPGKVQARGPFTSVHCDWSSPNPFAGGKVWIFAATSPTNRHCFLYDLDTRLIAGELFNAGPIFCNHDQTKILCQGRDSLATSIKQKFVAFMRRFPIAKKQLQKVNEQESFWVLNLQDNSTRRVGDLSQIPGTGSTWRPSPGLRYGCNVPNNAEEGLAFFLCDLETAVFEKINLQGDVQGWWDDSHILIRDQANNFILFDTTTHKTNTLFNTNALANSLREANAADSTGKIRAFNNWNGRDYDVYFALQNESYRAGESFLLKASHAEPELKLLYRKFKFEHLGRLDSSATHYLYNGESGLPGQGGNGGVFLRNLSDATSRTLVPPDGSGQYALARFYGNEIIYFRNRLPWRMDLNGSNNAPLFPPSNP